MPFVPTENQRKSLNNLIKQFIRESSEIRAIRFLTLIMLKDPNIIEIICKEMDDKYYIYHNGKISDPLGEGEYL